MLQEKLIERELDAIVDLAAHVKLDYIHVGSSTSAVKANR